VETPERMTAALMWIFGGTLIADLFMILLGEFGTPHASEVAARAAHDITHGKYRTHFWGGAIALGHLLPIVILLAGAPGDSISLAWAAFAAIASVVGLYLFEHAFVMAPQEIPNS
ncbi:MAG: 4Fe-4S ferredoxin, partial [Ardenticatenaceae bacterium]